MALRSNIRNLAALLATAILLAGCGGKEGDEDNSSALAAPDFTVIPVSGEGGTLTLADYEGKVLILDFWATWCGPCKREIPHFNVLYAEYKDRGLEILGASVDQGGPDVVKRFMQGVPIDYASAMATPEMQTAYGPIRAIPTTFIIDRKGRVQRRYIGYQDISIFREAVEQLL